MDQKKQTVEVLMGKSNESVATTEALIWETASIPKHNRDRIVTPIKAFTSLPALILMSFFLFISVLYWLGFAPSGAIAYADLFNLQELWRVFGALAFHSDPGHWAANALPFVGFGWLLFHYFGFWAFPVLSGLVGALSNILTVSLTTEPIRLLGASGMVYGMIGMWLALYLKEETRVKLKQKLARAVLIAIFFLIPQTYQSQVSHLAHFSGFGLGIVSGFCFPMRQTLIDR